VVPVNHDLHRPGPGVALDVRRGLRARVEPGEQQVRPTYMRTLGTAAVLAVVLTSAACGSPTGTGSNPSAGYEGCASQGTVVARADLAANGSTDQVRLVRGGAGRCADSLVARVGDRVVGVSVRGLDLVPKGAKVVHLKGMRAPDLVLVSSRPHPRGGSQPHLFGATGSGAGLREVTTGGNPVVPFVATDGGAPPMTARCTAGGGIVMLTAKAHQPPGIVLAWDLTRTTYAVRDGRAVETSSAVVRKAVADPLLRKKMPELFDGALFADCS
jgi:hypothetical protein